MPAKSPSLYMIFTSEKSKNHADATTAANKEKIMYILSNSFIRSLIEKNENEDNRGNALLFTLVWWSNANMPNKVLPSVEKHSHFKGTSSKIHKFECN